mmetsp:Transcript_97311/g.172264  ORF Transcript_97311/g.172264 Transcript_97311/m.172264 type:complete len:510 (-) Transcript_97311:82-1611(-)
MGRAKRCIQYSALELQDGDIHGVQDETGSKQNDQSLPCLARRFPLLPAAQVAAGMLPVAFCDSVLSAHLVHLLPQKDHDEDPYLRAVVLIVPLLRPLTGLLLSPGIGLLCEKTREFCGGSYRFFLVMGLMTAMLGQFLVAEASDFANAADDTESAALLLVALGSLLLGVAHAALGVVLRARLARGVLPGRLGTAFAMAALASELGSALGQAAAAVQWGKLGFYENLATEACGTSSRCFDVRICMVASGVLTVLAGLLATLAGASRVRQVTPNSVCMEKLLEDPGTRATLLASLLMCAGCWAKESHWQKFISSEIFGPADGFGIAQQEWLFRLALGIPVGLLLPRLLSSLGTFAVWLSGSLTLAGLLLLSFAIRSAANKKLTLLWLATFGGIQVLQLTLPPTILARRARARSLSVALAMGVVNVPIHTAELWWIQFSSYARELLDSELGIFGAGAGCAVWAAAVCSYAIACDRDGSASLACLGPSTWRPASKEKRGVRVISSQDPDALMM